MAVLALADWQGMLPGPGAQRSSAQAPGTCANRIAVAAGSIQMLGNLNATATVLGSAITYGPTPDAPIDVYVDLSTDGGAHWSTMFDAAPVSANAGDVLHSLAPGDQLVVRIHELFKRKGWLSWDQTAQSNDGTRRIFVLRNGDALPPFPNLAAPSYASLPTFLRNVISQSTMKVNVGLYDVLILTEQQGLDQSADFQDAALLLQFGTPVC